MKTNRIILLSMMLFAVAMTKAQNGHADIMPIKHYVDTIQKNTAALRTLSDAEPHNDIFKEFAPSPEAASLMQYSDYPVSLYTGLPLISIPIHTIKVGDYSLPVSLEYHASGIKVAQEASRVGLAWSLHAGGSVSRTIQSRDDFDEYGFYMCPDTLPNYFYSSLTDFGNISNDELDTESDIYHYNFAGYSGKFVVRKGTYDIDDGERFMLLNPSDNLRIEGFEDSFKITTEDNTQYLFNYVEERTSSNLFFEDEREGIYHDTSQGPSRTFIPPDETYFPSLATKASWLLGKIILPDYKVISFEYDTLYNSYLSPAHESYTEYDIIEEQYLDGFDHTLSKNEYLPKAKRSITIDLNKTEYILKSIHWNEGRIEFVRSEKERYDITGYAPSELTKLVPSENRALEYIKIYPVGSQEPLLSYKLHHSYFVAKHMNNGAAPYDTTYYIASRLRLDSITVKGRGCNEQKYRMEYDMSDNLPLKNEHFTDKWGYYTTNNPHEIPYYPCTTTSDWYYYKRDNNNSANAYISLDKERIAIHRGSTFYYRNGYESTSSPGSRTWMLTRLTNPMGAETDFEYECHDIHTTEKDSVYSTISSLPAIRIKNFNDTIIRIPVDLDNDCAYKLRLEYNESKNKTSNTNGYLLIATSRKIIWNVGYPAGTTEIQKGDTITRTFTLEGVIGLAELADTLLLSLGSTVDADVTINMSLQKIELSPKKVLVGGVRISKITSPLATTTFNYSDNGCSTGLLLREPRFSHPTIHFLNLFLSGLYKVVAIYYSIEYNSSTKRTAYNPYNGNHIGYSKVCTVKESNGENITEIHTFFNNPEVDYYYYTDHGTHNPMNGTRTRHLTFCNDILTQDVTYKYDTLSTERVKSLKLDGMNISQCYYVKNYYTYLDSMNTSTGNNNTSIKYVYHDSIYKPRKVTTYSTGFPTKTIEYTYSIDRPTYLDGTFKNNHLNTVPLMERHYVGNTLTNTIVRTHHDSRIVMPHKVFTFKGELGLDSDPVQLSTDSITPSDITYSKYTSQGRVTELVTRGGRSVVLLWSYNGQYVVAQINNATLSQVIGKGINVNELAKKGEPEREDWDKLYKLRDELPAAQVIINRYEPLTGLVSHTDPRGVETIYTYDEFNRLYRVLETDGENQNIVKQIEYKYATED